MKGIMNFIVAIFLIFLFILFSYYLQKNSSIQDSKQPNTQTIGNNQQTSQSETINTQPQTEEEQIKTLITKDIEDDGKIRKIEITKSDNDYIVIVDFNADDNLTINLQKTGIENAMQNAYYDLYKNFNNIANAKIAAYIPAIDKYGNQIDAKVYETQFMPDDAYKINWNNDEAIIKYNIIPNLWNLVYLSPLISPQTDN